MNGFLDPKEVIDKLELKEDMTACEFGSGSGSFTLVLAKKLKNGKVYATDIQKEPLSALNGRAKLENISNIETIRCDIEKECPFPNEFFDLVLISNLLFQVEEKRAIIYEAKRILKKEGIILIVDWKELALLGPKIGRVSQDEIKEIAQSFELKLKKEFKAGAFHWGLIFEK